MMNHDELLAHSKAVFDECITTMEKKNKDYAHDGDAFANFRFAEMVNVPVGKAILVRMSDKLARISNCINKGEVAVKTESVRDTLMDLINYTAILAAYLSTNEGEISQGA